MISTETSQFKSQGSTLKSKVCAGLLRGTPTWKLLLAFWIFTSPLVASSQIDSASATLQQDSVAPQTLQVKGQVSAYANYNFSNDLNMLLGGNFLPELVYSIPLKKKQLIDFDFTANVFGSVNFHPFDTAVDKGDVQSYRAWARYSGKQFEIRAGLQKINFGSAMSLRPLRWFDQVDPRDPLSLTAGVWGLLGRYYFLNNANVWLWGLYGNENPKGWEVTSTYEQIPEFGGRFQHPVPKGELAVTYHHRSTDSRNLGVDSLAKINNPENRIGLDGKWDLGVGVWFEASHSFKDQNIGIFTNQTLINIGMDYTFGVGNGINVIGEHLITSFDEKALQFTKPLHITALTASYPIGMFDNLSTVLYYDYQSQSVLTFLNYQRSLKLFTLYVMLYLNPDDQGQIQENDLINNFNGQGVQVMVVYNF